METMDEAMMKMMAEELSPDLDTAVQEIAQLLTFLPEEMRTPLVRNFLTTASSY